jgi:S1-C subfamily serine protease
MVLAGLLLTACNPAPALTSAVTPAPVETGPGIPPVKPANTATPTFNAEYLMISQVKPSVAEVVTDTGRGSGVVIDKRGYVLTCNHVLAGSRSIKVLLFGGFGALADKREFTATVLGRDEIKDLAILKVGIIDLPVAALGSSEKLTVGENVIAVSYPPLKLGLTMKEGQGTIGHCYVEAFKIDDLVGLTYIQLGASFSPGDSGGPVFNSAGEVVGIIVAADIVNPDLQYSSTGFAIAIDSIKPVIARLTAVD